MLQDPFEHYRGLNQMQLMLLEQANKKRLMRKMKEPEESIASLMGALPMRGYQP